MVGRAPPGAPAAILVSRLTHAAAAEAGSRTSPDAGRPYRESPSGPSSELGETTTARRLDRTRPQSHQAGGIPPASRGGTFPSAQTVLLGSYFAVAAGLAAWWLVGQFLLWRVTRSARPVPEAVRDVFHGLAGPGGGRVVLLESDRIAPPFTYTWRRPVILLALERSAMGASPAPSATSWRTSGRTSRGATPWSGTSPALRGSSSSISRCSGG